MYHKLITPRKILKLLSYWPPYLASGVSVLDVNKEVTRITVGMKLRPYNRNYVGTHFGGSLYSMCDPFYMFILLQHLSKEHIVWDKAACIEFVRPGKGLVRATFEVMPQEIDQIAKQALDQFKVEPEFETTILDEKDRVIAKVQKRLYVRRKDAKNRFAKNQ